MKHYFKEDEKRIFEATWQWVLDHSDITKDGVFFLKAHIKNKKSFKKSIRFRMKGFFRQLLDEDEATLRRDENIRKSIQGTLLKVEQENKERLGLKNY